jgi:3-deoxy-D-manno-octulosonate 8-phosphate phosphatase (KDO 8-P phosphatase)
MDAITEKAKHIKLVVFDVDGVLTDGGLILGESGNEYKIFHVRDGMGLVMLRDNGFHLAVITARSSRIVAERMNSLGIEYVYQGQDNKADALKELMKKLDVSKEETAYVGDDFLDIPAMHLAGFSITVADAHPFVRDHVDWVTQAKGGRGAAREVCELLLEAHGKLAPLIQQFLNE